MMEQYTDAACAKNILCADFIVCKFNAWQNTNKKFLLLMGLGKVSSHVSNIVVLQILTLSLVGVTPQQENFYYTLMLSFEIIAAMWSKITIRIVVPSTMTK